MFRDHVRKLSKRKDPGYVRLLVLYPTLTSRNVMWLELEQPMGSVVQRSAAGR